MPDPTRNQKILLDGIEPLRGAEILEKLAGGPVSDSWLLKAGDDRFVARLDKPYARILGLDRGAELGVLQTVSAAGIGPQIAWADADNGVLVTFYISGVSWSQGDVRDPARLEKLASTLRKLHALPPRGPVFTPGKMALAYARETDTPDVSRIAQQAATLAEELLSETKRPALCHNDLVHSNIIDGETVRLIDWEYAAVGDPYFDLATVVRHHQLKPDRVSHFLAAYFEAPTKVDEQVETPIKKVKTPIKVDFSRLDAFCRLYDQLAALWYLSIINQPGHGAIHDEELKRVMARLQSS